ncbi:hypothetical protein D3C87_1518220 [compost metagenome]
MKTPRTITKTLIRITARSRSTERTSTLWRNACRLSSPSATWTITRPPLFAYKGGSIGRASAATLTGMPWYVA